MAYAMAIICTKLGAVVNSASNVPQLLASTKSFLPEEDSPNRFSDEESLKMGDYRDILSLTRVLLYGPKSKADVDVVIERYSFQRHSILSLFLYYYPPCIFREFVPVSI